MNATVYRTETAPVAHRDRQARHAHHARLASLTSAPASVKANYRRSVRAAGKAALQGLLAEALADRAEGLV